MKLVVDPQLILGDLDVAIDVKRRCLTDRSPVWNHRLETEWGAIDRFHMDGEPMPASGGRCLHMEGAMKGAMDRAIEHAMEERDRMLHMEDKRKRKVQFEAHKPEETMSKSWTSVFANTWESTSFGKTITDHLARMTTWTS